VSPKSIVALVAASFVGLFLLTVVGGSFYTIDQGERGVLLRTGKVVGIAEPGLGFKLPIIDRVIKITTQDRTKMYERVGAYSRDQQPAELVISVTYRFPPGMVGEIYAQYGGEDGLVNRLLDRQVNEAVRQVFGQYNAVAAVQQREKMALDMREAVQKAVDGPVTVVGVQLENVDFSDAYENSIEQRMLAEVEVQKVQQNAEREEVQARIRVIQAQAEADARIAQATAEAEAIRMRGDAEAQAIHARGEALRKNPELVQLVLAETWNGVLPTTMVPGSTVPFLSMDRKLQGN
jgi:regulator of protease activity HflC (stomatin/prohibitin superfamily)